MNNKNKHQLNHIHKKIFASHTNPSLPNIPTYKHKKKTIVHILSPSNQSIRSVYSINSNNNSRYIHITTDKHYYSLVPCLYRDIIIYILYSRNFLCIETSYGIVETILSYSNGLLMVLCIESLRYRKRVMP